ncbi:MAG: tRNA dihydrouridine(20/20a) synthase DusA [Kiloniellales bacterium]
MSDLSQKLSTAPMMDWTDRYDRVFLRLISRRVLLYTEMIPTGAILRGDRERFLAFDPAERPLALQLGGAEPEALADCAAIAAERGFDEINLNVGCPSDRVQNARFGACLMAEPELVARCVAAMRRAAGAVPVTVKTRIGIDDRDSYAELRDFVAAQAEAGCERVIVHARKAWLQGLSPKQNRELPPLDYERVYALKRDFPDLAVVLNGGVTTLDQAAAHLARVDGVMIGRAAYQNPYILAEADRRFFGDSEPPPSREQVVERLLPYARAQVTQGVPVQAITRHILGLFNGLPGARLWRRALSEGACRPGAGAEVIEQALEQLLVVQRRRAAA